VQLIKGVIARDKGAEAELADINLPDPGRDEVVVRVLACGVCHTDLHYRDGHVGDEFPYLLGHEAAGIVESVGDGVTSVAPGDFVILNWRAVCGQCRACRRGKPWYCFATHNATQKMTLQDGTELTPALGIGAFAEKTLVHAGQCTKVDPAARPAAVALLGCGIMAGIGAAINTGEVSRGEAVAVIGCGGVGAAAIAGARRARYRTHPAPRLPHPHDPDLNPDHPRTVKGPPCAPARSRYPFHPAPRLSPDSTSALTDSRTRSPRSTSSFLNGATPNETDRQR